MTRSLWKGAISFGLVHIPVEMHTAVQSHDLDLTMLDRRDFSPIGFKRYNKTTRKDVSWDNIVKGYEYQDGEYVVLSDEDLRQANVKATQTIDILTFVDAADVPLTFYETPYYLTPARGGDKVYALLRETLRKTRKIAIATVVIRVRQHLCALMCVDDGIVLNTLRFSEEIRGTEELKLPPTTLKSAGISDKELQMALSLVEGMSEEWDPEQYHDTYKNDVLALVEKKVKAKQTRSITVAAPETKEKTASNVVDLVALLKQSLRGKPKGRAAADEEETQTEKPDDAEEAPARVGKRAAAKSGARRTRSTASRRAAKPAAKKAMPAKRPGTSTTTRRKTA